MNPDFRKVIVIPSTNHEVTIYFNELVRILRLAECQNSVEIAKLIKRIIYFCDRYHKTITDLNEYKVYKGDIRRIIMSPHEYGVERRKVEEIDNELEEYYKVIS